jgi:diacylglycerol kinase family enzyme
VYHTSRHVLVEAETPIGFHVDGDYAGEATSFEIELMPLALEVAV